MKLRWTAPAAQALQRITDHIAQDNPEAALQVAQRIRVAVSQLAHHPELGRPGRLRGTRELIIHGIPYMIPCRVKAHETQILSVYHTSGKWPVTFD